MLGLAIFGLMCSLMGFAIGVVQACRRRPVAPVLILVSLPGLLGCAYHTWRLWP